jgi:small subunit ribosomal protein S9
MATITESTTKKSTKKVDYIYAVGRRKTATARVRLFQKKGDMLVNGVAVGKYFPGEVSVTKYLKPLKLTGTFEKFSFSAKVMGGGKAAQLDAVVHGLARALSKLDREAHHVSLKKAGFLTRDSRMKQSRMIGMGGKSRRKKQSPKR